MRWREIHDKLELNSREDRQRIFQKMGWQCNKWHKIEIALASSSMCTCVVISYVYVIWNMILLSTKTHHTCVWLNFTWLLFFRWELNLIYLHVIFQTFRAGLVYWNWKVELNKGIDKSNFYIYWCPQTFTSNV